VKKRLKTAFGVVKTAFGVVKTAFGVVKTAFGVVINGFWCSKNVILKRLPKLISVLLV
jgi:hypothetical protein